MIFHDSTLKEMSVYFPQDKEELLGIKGAGLKKYESYGEEFIKIVKDYSTEKGIDSTKLRRESLIGGPIRESDMDRYQSTYDCYLEGLSLVEIAHKRGYTINTIIKHLERCEENGQVLDWTRFIDDPSKEEKVLTAIDKAGLERLRSIKEILPEEISYEDIRIIIIKNRL